MSFPSSFGFQRVSELIQDGFATSYVVLTPEKPIKYRSTWIALIVCMAFTSVVSILLRLLLARENRRRDAQFGAAPMDERGSSETVDEMLDKQQALDLTDGENKAFRYSL